MDRTERRKLKGFIIEVGQDRTPRRKPIYKSYPYNYKKGMEFSKWLMIFATAMFFATWLVAAFSWFLWGEFPAELAGYTTAFYTVVTSFYMWKSGYENKSKIEKGWEGDNT